MVVGAGVVASKAVVAPKSNQTAVFATPKMSSKAFFGNSVAFGTRSVSMKAQKMSTTMKASPVAGSYAGALLELAQATNAVEAIHADMDSLDSVCDDAFMGFLSNPTVIASKKNEVLAAVCKEGQYSDSTKNFLMLLVEKNRISQLGAIIAEFDTMYCEITDTQLATVTSAVKLENEQQFLIAKKLQAMTGAKNIKLKPVVDESLVGGFVVSYGPGGSSLIDMSVKGQIDKISQSVLPATV
mmetsp:Transcript_32633/g.45291  ORF Transcript_32633/g.45291 Transcript_32633/m.45291 type:complete len:241 (-) Transcript_32633:92-814(-)